MKSNAVVCAIAAMSIMVSEFALAQASTYEAQLDAERDARALLNGQQDRRSSRAGQADRFPNQGRPGNDQRRDERDAGPERQFHRGDRLPPQYHHRNYVVNDWRGHRLSAPPHGYHWVQVGSDYVLVAITTGIILQLMLNN